MYTHTTQRLPIRQQPRLPSTQHKPLQLTLLLNTPSANMGDVELWPDLRALNGNNGTTYDIFWDYCHKAIQLMDTGSEENRHSQSQYLSQPISTQAFYNQVVGLIKVDVSNGKLGVMPGVLLSCKSFTFCQNLN